MKSHLTLVSTQTDAERERREKITDILADLLISSVAGKYVAIKVAVKNGNGQWHVEQSGDVYAPE